MPSRSHRQEAAPSHRSNVPLSSHQEAKGEKQAGGKNADADAKE
jgi:hypothetical protein